MAAIVYLLCSASSILCAILLMRRRGHRLLFLSGLCFVGLALNNVILFVDVILVPALDLSLWPGLGYCMTNAYYFISGATMFGAGICGLFFVRFWTKTHDQFFLLFGLAFFVMALERVILLFLLDPSREDNSLIYLIRLTAFLIILFAIWRKNQTRT
jgi:hypothetical protein